MTIVYGAQSVFYALMGAVLTLYKLASVAEEQGKKGDAIRLMKEAVKVGEVAEMFAPNEQRLATIKHYNSLARKHVFSELMK